MSAESQEGARRPYKTTPVFDQDTVPEGLRRAHSTKAGVWGVIRVLEGRLLYRVHDGADPVLLTPGRPGLVRPQEPHEVAPDGRVRFQVEFYEALPEF